MGESVDQLSVIRRRLARIERPLPSGAHGLVATGHAAIDAALGGGLARGRLHEIFANETVDASSAGGFAAMLAKQSGGGIVWLRQDAAQQRGGGLHAPGLAELGIDPATLVLGILSDPLALLKAAAEVVRCAEVGVAIIELWRMPRQLDLTATRRVAMAADASGVTALLLRVDAQESPSAAQTRWTVRAAPCAPLEANAPGNPALDIDLVRQRGRPAAGPWRVEWNRDEACFIDQAISGTVFPLPADRSAGGGARRSA